MGGGKQMKWIFRIILLICFLWLTNISASFSQANRYSIDSEAVRKRKVSISYLIKKTVRDIKENHERKKEKKHERKVLKKVRKRAYSIQTKKTKKRIKQSKKKSEKYNKGKKPCSLKLKKLFKNG